VAENQPTNKNRMTTELSNFAARLRERVSMVSEVAAEVTRLKFQNPGTRTSDPNQSEPPHVGCYENEFNTLALELFALQFKSNAAYQKICEVRRLTPKVVEHWTQIPAVPTAAFKKLDLTCLAPAEQTTVFHSSGTTEQSPSRHFHNAESLILYEASLWPWFEQNVLQNCGLVILTPPPAQAPHSSLVHMFETVRQKLGADETAFVGKLAADGSWTLDFSVVVEAFSPRRQTPDARSQLLLGTAFSFVHLLDYLEEKDLHFDLPAGSRVMETGGYKNRSRSMPKTELHQLISEKLGLPPCNIICEYGMSELSSQAYDSAIHPRVFQFPPWARVQIISPETGREVADGETGLIRVFDLANVFSVMAIQTEDLGIRCGAGFELIGRATLAEPRGCSLMMLEGSFVTSPIKMGH
jgi:hypothetical protein